ncbi:transmembrane protein 53-like [Branchiostoma lanceolatum]|uniref:transmembrane protein 53-like n=1 Tax=Branchiostoma lanceolatum TaxID=7740 RepID=UPI003452FA2C
MKDLGEHMTLLLPPGQVSAHLSTARHLSPAVHLAPAAPLVVLIGWLNASRTVLGKYAELYTDRGFQVLLVRSQFSHGTQPATGRQLMTDVLDFLEREVSSQPIVLHVASMGFYMLGWMVYLMNIHEDKYGTVRNRVVGLVLDSPVADGKGAFNGMVVGLTSWTVLQMLIRFAVNVYYTLARQVVSKYEVLTDSITGKPILAPVLVLYSMDDQVCQMDSLQGFLGKWRSLGIEVTEQCWEKSAHVGHLVNHREEYLSALDGFLARQPLNRTPRSKL